MKIKSFFCSIDMVFFLIWYRDVMRCASLECLVPLPFGYGQLGAKLCLCGVLSCASIACLPAVAPSRSVMTDCLTGGLTGLV